MSSDQYKIISYSRDANRAGGGCAIFYNENRFEVVNLEIEAPPGVEMVWALFTPRIGNTSTRRVKRIAVGSVYELPVQSHHHRPHNREYSFLTVQI